MNVSWQCFAMVTTLLVIANGHALAQEIGLRDRGSNLARELCSDCHAIEKSQGSSPNLAAPPFDVIANVQGMTATALSAALQTSHRTMPNVMLDADQLRSIISYILSLQRDK